MAQGRIISKSISTSKKLSRVDDSCALLFTWIQPHTDDFGHMEADSEGIKSIVAPRRKWSVSKVKKMLEKLCNVELINMYEVRGQSYLEVVNFDEHQRFRSDRPKRADHPFLDGSKPDNNQRYDDGIPDDVPEGGSRQRKIREVKLSKDKVREPESIESVFSFWSSQNLIKPRTLNSDTEKEISKALGGYSLEEIKTAIEIYAAVLEKGIAKENKKYWWSHSWTLYEFLKRGLKQFVGKTPADYLIAPIVYQEKPSQKVDRFDLTKKAV